MKHNDIEVKLVAKRLSSFMYKNNLQATKELMELLDKITFIQKPNTTEDYVNIYDNNFYTYPTWEELVKSEKYQVDGLTEKECMEQLNKTIWQIPCGWYVQYV